MGIRVHRLFPANPPLAHVSEQVMVIPAQRGVPLRNSSFKIVHFIEGHARLDVDGREICPLASGDTVVLPFPCRQHYLSPQREKDSRAHALIMRFHLGEESLTGEEARFAHYLHETFSRPRHLPAQGRREFHDLLARLRREGDRADAWREAAVQEIVRQFVFQTAELLGIHPPPPPAPAQARVDAICSEAVRQLYQQKPPQRLFPAAPPGPLFKRRMGISFQRYVAGVRAERAKEEMIHSGQPLSVIARRTGFCSSAEFSRTFRAVTGLSPRDYREQLHDHTAEQEAGDQDQDAPAAVVPAPSPVGGMWKAEQGALIFCLRGEAEARSARRKLPLSAEEETVLVAAGRSNWKFVAALPELCLAAVPVPSLPLTRSAQNAQNALINLPRGRELQEARRRFQAEGLHHALAAQSFLKSAAIDALRQLDRAAAGPGKEHQPSGGNRLPVDYAREFLHKNYGRPVRLAEVAWFAGVSEEHLARAFRHVTGKSVMEYLKEWRLRSARAILLESSAPLSKVAERCGFGSAALLCRVFKAREGCTPGEFRRTGGFCKV